MLHLLLVRTRTSSIKIIANSIGILTLGILLVLPIKDTYPFITGWYGGISFNDIIAGLIGILELDILLELPTRTNR